MFRTLTTTLATILTLAAAPVISQRSDPFYLGLLRDGQLSMEREDPGTAIEQLRLACFGLLEDTPVLAECLTRLALAQSRVDDAEAFEATFRRILEIEDRFGAYSVADLSADLREDLEAQAQQRLPEGFLAAAGFPPQPHGFSSEAKILPLSTVVSEARPLDELEVGRTTLTLATKTASADREPVVAPSEGLLTEEDLSTLDQLAEQLREVRTFDELLGILETARAVADRHPVEPTAQHLVAQLAYRASRWEDSVEYFRRGGDPGEDNPNLLFYYAVALYETGELEEAAQTLDRCVTQLKRTEYVDSYIQKILGDRS